MKNIWTIFLLLTYGLCFGQDLIPLTNAQDTIFERGGKVIKARILNVGEKKITFKNHRNKEDYIKIRHTLAIKYASGQQQVFKITPPEPYRGKMESDYDYSIREAKQGYRRGIAMTSIGGFICLGGAALIGVAVGMTKNDITNPMGSAMAYTFGPMFSAGGIALCISGPLYMRAKKRQIRVLEQFKQELSFAPTFSPAFNGGGIGMILKF